MSQCPCTYIHMCISNTFTYTYMYIHTYVHVCVSICFCEHLCTYVIQCECVYMCMCVHSTMQGFVRQLQEVETHSTEYVKSVTYIPSHTHAQGEISSDMPPSQSQYVTVTISQYQSLLCNTCTLYVYLATYILPLLFHPFTLHYI